MNILKMVLMWQCIAVFLTITFPTLADIQSASSKKPAEFKATDIEEVDDVSIKDNLAYVVAKDYLQVYATSHLQFGKQLGMVWIPSACQVTIFGNLAFVLGCGRYLGLSAYERSKGLKEYDLYIVDISNPEQMAVLGSFCAFIPSDIEVSGNNTACLTLRHYGLKIVDFSNPRSPSLISDLKWGIGPMTRDELREMSAEPAAKTGGLNTALGLAVNDKIAYIADGYGGLKIIDISDVRSPTIIANLDLSTYATNVKTSGNVAYLASRKIIGFMGKTESRGGLFIIDVSNPTNPQVQSIVSASAYGVVVINNLAFLATDDGVVIIDISNSKKPTMVKYFPHDTAIWKIAVNSNKMYCINARRQLLWLELDQ